MFRAHIRNAWGRGLRHELASENSDIQSEAKQYTQIQENTLYTNMHIHTLSGASAA